MPCSAEALKGIREEAGFGNVMGVLRHGDHAQDDHDQVFFGAVAHLGSKHKA
jgi:hypothetical protein